MFTYTSVWIKRYKSGLLLPLVFFASPVFCQALQSPPTIGPEIDGWIMPDGKGYFLELSNVISEQAGYKLNYQTRPLARAIREFTNKSFECYLGGEKSALEEHTGNSIDLIESDPFFQEEVAAYTLRIKPRISSLNDLEGKAIGIMLGENAELFGLERFKDSIVLVRDVNVMIEMPKLNRIQVMVDYTFGGSVNESKIQTPFHYDKNFILYRVNHQINCHPSTYSKAFVDGINKAFGSLDNSETLRAIYDRYYEYYLNQ